jgi:hypothetical protein
MNRYYVYALIDPRDGKAFYIGKGHDNRRFHHEKNAVKRRCRNKHLEHKILQIKAAGFEVVSELWVQEEEEDWCFLFERIFITSLRPTLVNISEGGEGTSIRGEKHHCYGTTWTEERRLKTSGPRNGMYGKVSAFKGKTWPLEECLRISERMKGVNVGRNWTDTQRAKFWATKLTESDVLEIFRLRKEGLSQRKIATKFGINQTQVSRILRGRRWKHVLKD